MNYKVAVLVAIYKAGRFLSSKLDSLRAQTTFKDCQILLLNCQNLDYEQSIYRNFAKYNKNVIVIEYSDYITLYRSWNNAISITTAEYITNSNCDDQLHPECFAKLINALDNNKDYDLAHCDHYVTACPNISPLASNFKYHGLIETQYPLGTLGPGPMYRKSLHNRFGLYEDYRSISDSLFWNKLHIGGIKFYHIPEPLIAYYQECGHNLETRLDEATGKSLRDLDLEEVAKNAK